MKTFTPKEICASIEALPEDIYKKQIRHKITQMITCAHYFSWFHRAKFWKVGNKIYGEAPDKFAAKMWEERYSRLIIKLEGMSGMQFEFDLD